MCYIPVFGVVVTLKDFLKYFYHCYPHNGDKFIPYENTLDKEGRNEYYPHEYKQLYESDPKIINNTQIPFGILSHAIDGSTLRIGIAISHGESDEDCLLKFNERLNKCSNKEVWLELFGNQQPHQIEYLE